MTKIIGLTILLTFSTSSIACDAEKKAAEQFLNSYIEMEFDVPVSEWLKSSDMVSDSFIASYDDLIEQGYKTDPEIGLGYDLIIKAQDIPDEYVAVSCTNGVVQLEGNLAPQFKTQVTVKANGDRWYITAAGDVVPNS